MSKDHVEHLKYLWGPPSSDNPKARAMAGDCETRLRWLAGGGNSECEYMQGCKDALRVIASERKARRDAEAERDVLSDENTRIRAALAASKDPCIYCSLPAAEMAKCTIGFPGCERANDSMGCPELGASLDRDALRAENDRMRKALGDVQKWFADLVTDGSNWPPIQTTPTLTQEMCDRAAEMQAPISAILSPSRATEAQCDE